MAAITSEFSSTPDLPKWIVPVLLLAFAYGVIPLIGSSYLFEAILLPFLALSLAGVGLNILTGYAGQVSLGSAAFMAAAPSPPTISTCASKVCRWLAVSFWRASSPPRSALSSACPACG